ncbi:uncharacterized protein LOC128711436 [Anopheles marshallii]|uniref:uncharacterized protein LOC128711436 n=1 Tax=Anopheles marshallii TaxID=1521116 RepID=UPI00237A957B|nr:uncharacterized protein LOC128711436 [Anopheles marshallii]
MSETVIISKTSPRQRPQPREPPTAAIVGNTICSVGDPGRLEKLGSKSSKSTAASLVMVKELVHRDNSRLVKDLMALLAIREATKEVTGPHGPQSTEGDGAVVELKRDETLHKNRPGDTAARMIPATLPGEQSEQHGGGTKVAATMTAAAVASLLHHTATKEFSSLAGEIIAIADDTPTANSNEDAPLDGRAGDGMVETGTANDEMMLHADAAAPELNTNGKSTDHQPAVAVKREEGGCLASRKDRPPCQGAKGEFVTVGNRRRYDEVCGEETEQREQKTDVSACGDNLPQRPSLDRLLSGPVPVSFPPKGDVGAVPERTATPVPTYGPPYICHGLVAPTVPDRPAALTLEQKLDKLLDSVVKIKADMHRRIDRLGKRVEQIHLDVQLNIDSTDRALLRNDLLLIGIPHREREDLHQCFRAVCRALEYTDQDIPQVDIRRQRVPGGSRRVAVPSRAPKHGDSSTSGPDAVAPAPIVVEFMFKTLRDQFYRAYQAKRVLRLSDIGFVNDRRFFVNEVLTKYNQKLMAEAVRRKRLGLLHSVYTVDGIVYVQRAAGEKGTKVISFSSLN